MNNRRYNNDRSLQDRNFGRNRDRFEDSRYDNYQSRSPQDRDWRGYNNNEGIDTRRNQQYQDRFTGEREHSYFLENRNPGFQTDFNDFDSSPDRGLMGRDRGLDHSRERDFDRGDERGDYSASRYSAYGSDDYGRHGSDTMDDWGTRRDWSRRDEHPSSRSGGLMNAVKNFFGKGPKGYKRSDERIKEDVSEVLYRDPRVDASDIEIDVKDGNVTLQGTVESRDAKRRAEDVIEQCLGVVNVSNHLRVAQNIYASDARSSSGMNPISNEPVSTDKKGRSLQ